MAVMLNKSVLNYYSKFSSLFPDFFSAIVLHSPRRIDSDKKKHVTLPNNIFQSTFMFVSYRRRHYLLPRAAITAEIVVSDASMTSGTRRRPLETARGIFFSNEFPRGHYLVWWVRVRVKCLGRVNFVAMVKVSKLLGSNFNPTSNFALTLI